MTSEPDNALFIAITADVDPDANQARPGRPHAVTADAGEQVTFDACFDGLAALLGMLQQRSLPATLFHDGRALEALAARRPGLLRSLCRQGTLEHGTHGYGHEDFAGKTSGIPLNARQTTGSVARAGEAIRNVLDAEPRGFRAPYCRLTPHLKDALAEAGYAYDASLTRPLEPDWGLRPYRVPDEPRLHELALCRATDRRGAPISCYLWQLFEDNRTVDDYLALIRAARETCPGGLLQIALHPWHLLVSAEGRPLKAAALPRLDALLDRMEELPGVAFTTAGAYLASCTPVEV